GRRSRPDRTPVRALTRAPSQWRGPFAFIARELVDTCDYIRHRSQNSGQPAWSHTTRRGTSMPEYTQIKYEVVGPVARVSLNRPRYKNAQSVRLIEELDWAFAEAAGDPEVRVIVLRGEG